MKYNPHILPDADVVALYKSGLSMHKIAIICQCADSQILVRLRRNGIASRSNGDYEVTDKQREARRKTGASTLGRKRTDETRARISEAKKKYRKRSDYEFGGHEKINDTGYYRVFVPDHPCASADGFVLKHRLIMEREIGRLLRPDEVVHHKNGIRTDNRIENLQLMTKREHDAYHTAQRMEKRRAAQGGQQ